MPKIDEVDIPNSNTRQPATVEPLKAPRTSIPQSKAEIWQIRLGATLICLSFAVIVALIVATLFGHRLPNQTIFLISLLFGLTFSVSIFIMSAKAIVDGEIQLDFVKSKPITFSAGGGIAAFLIVSFFVNTALHRGEAKTALAELESRFWFANDLRNIVLSVHKCDPLVKNWGGRYTADEINALLNIFDEVGNLKTTGKAELADIKKVFGDPITATLADSELQHYIDCGIRQGPRARWDKYKILAVELKGIDQSVFDLVSSKCGKYLIRSSPLECRAVQVRTTAK